MKKNIIRLFAVALIGSFAWSCVSLEEEPKAIAAETFYSSETECQVAVAAALHNLSGSFRANWYNLMEPWSDYTHARVSSSFAFMNDFDGLTVTGRGWSDEAWTAFYKGIRDCNCALAKLPGNESMSESAKAPYIAEFKFLRALGYFYLVRFWGSIPLRTEENVDNIDLAKSSETEVYDLILSDLQYAVQHCPAKPRTNGLPAVNIAKSLLALVYLELEDYANAAKYSKEVIDSQEYSLVAADTTSTRPFDNVFNPFMKSTEEVFYIQSSNQQMGYTWVHPIYCSQLLCSVDGKSMGFGSLGLGLNKSIKTIAEWDDNDLRKKYNVADFPLAIAAGFPDINACNSKYIDYNNRPLGLIFAQGEPPIIRYPEVMLTYAEAATKAGGAPTQDAMNQINQIHRRGYGLDPYTESAIDFKLSDYSTKDQFMELLIKEQLYELWNEGKRWPFLRRLGKETVNKYIGYAKGKTPTDKCYLYPIPSSEFDYNKALDPGKDQNPGYNQ